MKKPLKKPLGKNSAENTEARPMRDPGYLEATANDGRILCSIRDGRPYVDPYASAGELHAALTAVLAQIVPHIDLLADAEERRPPRGRRPRLCT